MVNSKRNGKTGELSAVKFLRSLGFEDARRTVQYNGQAVDGQADVTCPRRLPHIHFEVKTVKAMRLGNKLWHQAIEQAARDSKGLKWCLLWREHGRGWLVTFAASVGGYHPTLCVESEIKRMLRVWELEPRGGEA